MLEVKLFGNVQFYVPLSLLTLLSWSSMASNVFLKTQFHCGSTSRPLAATSIVENMARGGTGAEGGRALATSPRSPALYGGIERMICSAGVVSMESDSALCSWSRLVSAAQSFTQLQLPDHTTYIVQLHYITWYLQQPASASQIRK